MPYLEVKKEQEAEKEEVVEVPDFIGLSIKEAKEKAKEIEIEVQYEKEENINEEETVIKEQFPKPGIKIKKENKVTLEL